MVIGRDVVVSGTWHAASGTAASVQGLRGVYREACLAANGRSSALCGRCGVLSGGGVLHIEKRDVTDGQTDAVSDTDAAVVGRESR